MVRQHHAAGSHANAGCPAGNMLDHDLRSAAGQPWGVVVLGVPDPMVTKLVGELREFDRAAAGIVTGSARRPGRRMSRAVRSQPSAQVRATSPNATLNRSRIAAC